MNLDQYFKRNDHFTLDELIEELENLRDHEKVSGDTPVVISYNYGDHWNSQVAEPVQSAELLSVRYSGYHNKLKVEQEEYDEEEGAGGQTGAIYQKVILLGLIS